MFIKVWSNNVSPRKQTGLQMHSCHDSLRETLCWQGVVNDIKLELMVLHIQYQLNDDLAGTCTETVK